MSPDAQTYLKEVWGYDRIEDVDDQTMGVIAENVMEARIVEKDWPLDEELWKAFVFRYPDRAEAVAKEVPHPAATAGVAPAELFEV